MKNFDYVPLNDLIKRIKVGFVGSIEKYYCSKEEGVLLLRTSNLTNSGIDYSDVKYVTREFFEKNKKSQLHKNDVLIARHGDNGKANIYLSEEDAQALNVVIIEPDEHKLSPSMITYFLEFPYVKKQINGGVGGSVQGVINTKQIAELIIPYCENIDYKKVDSLLRGLEAKINNNLKIMSHLENVARTIYDYWFLQFDFPNDEGKPYKSSGGCMEWNDSLKRSIPRGWSTTTIGDVSICHDSDRIPLSANERESMIGDIPYYGATDIMGYVNRAIFCGDYVLLAEDGSVMDESGHPIMQRITGSTWVNNHAHVLEPIEGYSCKLLMMLLKDVYVPMIKTGSIQMKINQENMNNIGIVDIPNTLRERMNNILMPIDRKLLSLQEENNKLLKLREFLLPMLLNGQISF